VCCFARGSHSQQLPQVNGKDLDLYALYREVTKAGGVAVVIASVRSTASFSFAVARN
jgi:hypothetical protein